MAVRDRHFMMAPIRCRTRRAVSRLSCQMGSRTVMTSAVVTQEWRKSSRLDDCLWTPASVVFGADSANLGLTALLPMESMNTHA